MALQEDANVEFSISEPVSTYLPYDGPYADRTVEQMVSNTSGIPGLRLLPACGSPMGPTIEDFNHLCQYSAQPIFEFEACGRHWCKTNYPRRRRSGPFTTMAVASGKLRGVTASTVANATWNQLVDQYLGTPCGLEVFTFGNPWESPTSFTGSVDSLAGTANPNIEGGAITNIADYAQAAQHLNGGFCGDTQVMRRKTPSPACRWDRGGGCHQRHTLRHGMVDTIDNPGVFTDPGAFGAVSFIDVNRGIDYMAIDEYGDAADSGAPPGFFIGQAIPPAIQAAWDAAR